MYAYITSNKQNSCYDNNLKIDSWNVRFFTDPIQHYSQFCQSADGKQWQLTFFQDTPFTKTLWVTLADFRKSREMERDYVGKGLWIDSNTERQPLHHHRTIISQFLRDSDTLPVTVDSHTTQGRALITDRHGVAYVADKETQFYRVILCQALAIAYSQVLEQCIEKLVLSLKRRQETRLEDLYKDVLAFNATDYFRYPIRLDRHELFAVWRQLSDHWHLNELNQELVQQLSGIAQLLREHREREEDCQRQAEEKKRQVEEQRQKQIRDEERRRRHEEQLHLRQQESQAAKRENRFNRRLAWASVLLGFLSALSLVNMIKITVPFKTLKTASASPRFSVWLNRSYPMNSGPLSSRYCHRRRPSRVVAGLPSPTVPP